MSDNQSENSDNWKQIFQEPKPTLQEVLERAKYSRSPGRRETDPNGVSPNEPGAKLDAGKLQPWLFFSGFAHALEKVAEVTTKGAAKYTRNGWVTVPNGPERYMEAYGRHVLKYGQGEVYDNGPGGTGCKHLAQMIWNLLAVLELQERNDKSNSK